MNFAENRYTELRGGRKLILGLPSAASYIFLASLAISLWTHLSGSISVFYLIPPLRYFFICKFNINIFFYSADRDNMNKCKFFAMVALVAVCLCATVTAKEKEVVYQPYELDKLIHEIDTSQILS